MAKNLPRHVQTEDKSFVRDTQSKALLNTDRAALERHRVRRQKDQAQGHLAQEVSVLTQTQHQLEARIEELTRMMHVLIEKL